MVHIIYGAVLYLPQETKMLADGFMSDLKNRYSSNQSGLTQTKPAQESSFPDPANIVAGR